MATDLKWAILQPLVNGFGFGAELALKKKPEFILSSEGIGNDDHIKQYWKDVPFFTLDAEGNFTNNDMAKAYKELKKNINVLIGTPVCAGLSLLNVGKGKVKPGVDNPSNENMYSLARFAMDDIKPDVYVFENSPMLFSPMGLGVYEKLKTIAEDKDYSTSLFRTDTYLHGIPQHRQRTFMYFWKQDDITNIETPILEYYKRDVPHIDEYLKDIPKDATLNNVTDVIGASSVIDIYVKYAQDRIGEDWKQKILDAVKGSKTTLMEHILKNDLTEDFKDFIEKSDYNRKENIIKQVFRIKAKKEAGGNYWNPSPDVFGDGTINAVTGKMWSTYLHNTEDRLLTGREMMHLMGLPHDYNLVPSSTGVHPLNHIAQNVPTCTARDVILNAQKGVKGELTMMPANHIKQSNLTQTIVEMGLISDTDDLFK
jgi:site-specific DNA-cytosine methylase